MEKNEIVEAVLRRTDIGKRQAGEAVDAVFESITDALKGGSEVRLVGFGTFSVTRRAASEGRNPRSGEKIRIAASKHAKFPSKRVVDHLAGLGAALPGATVQVKKVETVDNTAEGQVEDENAVAEAFADAASELLSAADQALAEMQQLRKETVEILGKLEVRLTSAHG